MHRDIQLSIVNITWGLKRYYGAGDLHFITSSCYHREPRLGSVTRRDLFLTVLEQMRQVYSFVVVGYVVMPEHFHLLISEPQEVTPSTAIQALKLGVVQRLEESGHFWQRRFYDFNVWTENKRVEKLNHMHHNPVKRGLVEKPEQWAWSSYRHLFLRSARPGPYQSMGCFKDEDSSGLRLD